MFKYQTQLLITKMQVNIGLIGIGTIGAGVVKILGKNSKLIEQRTGVKLNLKKVCDVKLDNAKSLGLKPEQLTKNADDIFKDKSISIVMELIGGYEPAHTFIMKAIKAKKHVVTANKAVIAKYGKEIFEAAVKNKVNVKFEAAVGGCIPIIRALQHSYVSQNIKKIYGILNGTTNFILTRMEEGMSYEDALRKAQQLGFAEADPSFDVEGKDASQKLGILAMLSFNSWIDTEIRTEGITRLSKNDLIYADELGYKIKLLGIAKKDDNEIELRVHPTMIPKSHGLAAVKNELNAVYISGEDTGEGMLYGKGAGQMPTATVVVGDVVDIARNLDCASKIDMSNKLKIKDSSLIKSKYYLKFTVLDKPGVLAKIATILGNNNISIAAVAQKEIEKDIVPVIIITHTAIERDLIKAVKEINSLQIVKDETVLIRIEDLG